MSIDPVAFNAYLKISKNRLAEVQISNLTLGNKKEKVMTYN